MMRKIINKHWNVLQINPKLQETFQNNPSVAFKRNKNLRNYENQKSKMEKCLKAMQKKKKKKKTKRKK